MAQNGRFRIDGCFRSHWPAAAQAAPQVEFAAELRYYFPSLEISVVSSSEGCVPSMPKGAQDYIQRYFDQHNITKLVKKLGRHEEK